MGSGAGALRRNKGQCDTIEWHVRLNVHAGMGVNAPRTVFTVSRIPSIEIEMLEPETASDTPIDYDDDYDDDYEAEAASDIEHWLANDGRDIDMA